MPILECRRGSRSCDDTSRSEIENRRRLIGSAAAAAPAPDPSHRPKPSANCAESKPYWFIWRELAAKKSPNRRWGPEQMIGKPNCTGGRDQETAWATKLENNPVTEWLIVEYARVVKATFVEIHESFNPGAVSKVSIFRSDGEEVVAWRAKKVGPIGKKERILKIPMPLGFQIARLKIYLETTKVRGWNEIDAVAVVDDKGVKHWAAAAQTSTTYATDRNIVIVRPKLVPVVIRPGFVAVRPGPVVAAGHVKRVLAENAKLRKRVQRLEQAMAKMQASIEALQRKQ